MNSPAELVDVKFSDGMGPAVPPPIRVLLIEDNKVFAYFIRDVLERKHDGLFEVFAAEALEPGLAILDRGEIDVVLLDLGLPDSRRYDTFFRTRDRSPRTPIIILTALDDDELAMKAMGHGAQDYLVKDQVNKDLLVRSIRYSIERVHAEEELSELSGRLLQLQDEERRRIARELHDTTAQNLAAIAMNLSLLEGMSQDASPEAARLLSDSVSAVAACSRELRTMSYLLHPPLLDELGLAGAVREYADGFAERSGIRVDLELPPGLGRLPKEAEMALFRVMQECLTNVHRHSGSSTASICFSQSPDETRLIVQDKGHGIRPSPGSASGDASPSLGVGLPGMRERLLKLGGRLVTRSDGKGTTITAVLPTPEPAS